MHVTDERLQQLRQEAQDKIALNEKLRAIHTTLVERINTVTAELHEIGAEIRAYYKERGIDIDQFRGGGDDTQC